MKYLRFLEPAFVVHKVIRYDIKGLRNLELYEKFDMGDIGLHHGLLGNRDQDIGGLLENVVHLELLSRGYRIVHPTGRIRSPKSLQVGDRRLRLAPILNEQEDQGAT